MAIYGDFLSSHFDLVKTSSSIEAIDILKKDLACNIKAVITDWRLYADDSNTHWQSPQGYLVLKEAANYGFRALFALSSQPDYVVHQIRNILGIKFSMFKKEQLRTDQEWQFFIDCIHNGIQEMQDLQVRTPKSKNWDKSNKMGDSYASLYREKLFSDFSDSFFDSISTQANDILNKFHSQIDNNERTGVFKYEYDLEVESDLNIEKLLILRRLWLGLFYFHTKDNPILDKLSMIRAKSYVYEKICGGGDSNNINVELNKVCLQDPDFKNKSRILPEEYAWLVENGYILAE